MNTKVITVVVMTGLVLNTLVLYWLFFTLNSRVEKQLSRQSIVATNSAQLVSDEDEGEVVERNVTFVGPTSGCGTECVKRIDDLEREVEYLKSSLVPAAQSTTTTASVGAKEVYVPLGSGSSQSRDWEDVPGMAAYIDSSAYSNMNYIQFEGSLRIPSGVGRVYARVYNKTDGNFVWSSEVTTETDTAYIFQSEHMALASGNKLYQIQLKSTVGALALIESARIKIVLK